MCHVIMSLKLYNVYILVHMYTTLFYIIFMLHNIFSLFSIHGGTFQFVFCKHNRCAYRCLTFLVYDVPQVSISRHHISIQSCVCVYIFRSPNNLLNGCQYKISRFRDLFSLGLTLSAPLMYKRHRYIN